MSGADPQSQNEGETMNDTTPIAPQPAAAPAPGRSNWVLITTSIVGGAVLFGTIVGAAITGIYSATRDSNVVPQLLTAEAEGITRIDVDASAARFTVTCERPGGADDDVFTLSTSTGEREWRMETRRGALRVEPVNRWFGGFSLIGPRSDARQDVALLLPASACEGGSPLDAGLAIGAGEMQVDGPYGELDIEIGAGEIRVDGTAREVDVEIGAGEAALYLGDVRSASLSVSAGSLRGGFEGRAPGELDIEVSAGAVDLRLPDEGYAIESSVAAGDFDNRLKTDPQASRQIEVDIAAGSVTLRPQDR